MLVELDLSDLAALGRMSPEAYLHRMMLIWIGSFGGGGGVYVTWIEWTRFPELGRESIEIDLLDLSAVAPLSRFRLRHALITIVLCSLIVPMFYDSEAAPNLFWILLVVAPFRPLAGDSARIMVRRRMGGANGRHIARLKIGWTRAGESTRAL